MSKQEILLSNSAIEFLKDEIGGGTNVVANPELSGTETVLTGLQVGNTKYAVPHGSGGRMEFVTLNYVLDGQPHNITQEQATKLQNGAILTDQDGKVYSLVGTLLADDGTLLYEDGGLAYQCIIFNSSFARIEEVDGIIVNIDMLLYQCMKLGQPQ